MSDTRHHVREGRRLATEDGKEKHDALPAPWIYHEERHVMVGYPTGIGYKRMKVSEAARAYRRQRTHRLRARRVYGPGLRIQRTC